MARTYQIPIPAEGQSPLAFPERCACCGEPRQAESILQVNRQVQKRQKPVQVSVKYAIPHCARCARSTKAVFLAGCIPFVLGLIIVGALAFAAGFYGASRLGLDEHGQPNNANSLIVGAAAGLFAGIVGGFLFELAARLVLLPVFGRALWQAPLLAAQLLNDSDHVAGLTAKPDRDASHILLTFSNEAIAAEFAALNAALLARSG